MNVFELRDGLIKDYAEYVGGFINIRDERIRQHVTDSFEAGQLWPDPLIQLNPCFEPGKSIDELVTEGVLHPECANVFRKGKTAESIVGSKVLQLYRHQEEAVRAANSGANYVLTTGTGSGKSLAYIIPIINHVLCNGSGKGIKAIIIYPMNALANSQFGELGKFLKFGYPEGGGPVTFRRYTGQEGEDERNEIVASPPDILLTNYVMLELILTRPFERGLIQAAQGLRFLVLDELHTYRGRQGADVAMLVRRVRDALSASKMQCVGTSATLASGGTFDEQRAEIARVASKLFGAEVKPQHVIGETLRRVTPERDMSDADFIAELRQRVADVPNPPTAFAEFVKDPLSVWIEARFGIVRDPVTGRLVRSQPRTITGETGAASELATVIGMRERPCEDALKRGLLAGYTCQPDPATGFQPFAFRLHQFICRGDTVYASPESESDRYLTLNAQQFVPGDRSRVLLPLVFCRECGQEYYCVRKTTDPQTGMLTFTPRELSDRLSDENGEAGFLFQNTESPWPDDLTAQLERLPEDWIETVNDKPRVKQHYRSHLPRLLHVSADGKQDDAGVRCHYVVAPFRFCLNCGVAYGGRQSSDFAKLSSLATEGRSTATTVLTISAVLHLKAESSLPAEARKLLSFTDNRQDASLQAGHFNDFVEIGLLRSALFKAASDAGDQGLAHDEIALKVFAALNLPLGMYAKDPTVRFQPRQDTDRALREVIAYRLYHDLRRGWRVTAPNLEQCGLLEIEYQSLAEACAAEDIWQNRHPALVGASTETRLSITKALLDFMRRSLCIDTEFLNGQFHERLILRSSQRLKPPWAIDEDEKLLVTSSWLVPRPKRNSEFGGNVYLSPRGGFGQYLRRSTTFPEHHERLTLEDTGKITSDLLAALSGAGLLTESRPQEDDVPNYQLPAALMLWRAGDGSKAFHDPIRTPRQPDAGCRTNPFFVQFYQAVASTLQGLEAHEHTAQVPNDVRMERETLFRTGELPILFCSPTMELGVDIAQLNVVNMRNVPPTPANYAQRSGRAGRSGQPALVFSYCATGNSHDQYFFKRPHLMVAGAVAPPRLDIANQDLVRSHVQAIWLAQTHLDLGKSLKEVLELTGEPPSLKLQAHVLDDIRSEASRDRAYKRATAVLKSVADDLAKADWYSDDWLGEVLTQIVHTFDRTCDRWRALYMAAYKQRDIQNRIIGDAARSSPDKEQARRLRREAEAQLDLLLEVKHVIQSDFYSYRYFASEGFLPGYNFPRLPLSAFIPARRGTQRDEFLSRPRFLAISEFGPKAMVYHEGSKYIINKVIMPVEPTGDVTVATARAKQCPACGYLHPILQGDGVDICERCEQPLTGTLNQLFRLQNVSTKRRDRINCDEEERLRLGYELRTGIRFAERGGIASYQTGRADTAGSTLAKLTYGHAATLWRINLGWARRENRNQHGFVLDVERGYWGSNKMLEEEDQDDPMSTNCIRVIPYVEDRKNCLLFESGEKLSPGQLFSLQAALTNAIQVRYQLEESEIAAEPLPDSADPHLILLYESAEGGAGVLRHLLDSPDALAEVAREALRLCHFDPATGKDLRMAPGATEECEAACYNCLMSYSNQRQHELLDRQCIKDILLGLAGSSVHAGPAAMPRAEHLQRLMKLCDSELERKWLQMLETKNLRLPTSAQKYVYAGKTRPDFVYEGDYQTAIYVDGPPHDYPERHKRDDETTARMEDDGWIVIRFRHFDDWDAKLTKYPNIFGSVGDGT